MVAKKAPNGRCTICAHPQRARIDFLAVTAAGEWGSGRRSLALKFGISAHALYRHCRHHISEEYRRAVRVGPFESEERLRQLLADEGASVLDRFNSLYRGHLGRWLAAFEAGNDEVMARHGAIMGSLLAKVGVLTREMLPPGAHTRIENNFFLSPDFHAFQRRAVAVLRRHPEALHDWCAEFRPEPPEALKMINGHAESAD
jgi:hypothetical protein